MRIYHKLFRFALRTLKEFGFGKFTMENVILNDAISLTNIVESLAKSGPITKLHDIISIAVLNSLWSLIAGSRYVYRDICNYIHAIALVVITRYVVE